MSFGTLWNRSSTDKGGKKKKKSQVKVQVQEKALTWGWMDDTGGENWIWEWQKKIASDVRKENFNFSRVCRSDYLETRSTAELKGQNHVSGWESKTNSVLHKAPLLEIASGVQQPSVGEERDCTVNEISSLSRSALAVAFPMNRSSCLGCLEVNRTASPWWIRLNWSQSSDNN